MRRASLPACFAHPSRDASKNEADGEALQPGDAGFVAEDAKLIGADGRLERVLPATTENVSLINS